MNKINVLLYGSKTDCKSAFEKLKECTLLSGYHCEPNMVDNLEELEIAIVDKEPTLSIVLADGAEGMEGVYLIKNRMPTLPVFWFSNDRKFCLHSHRLNCAYFSVKPVTAENISKAIQRCIHIGISFCVQ